MGFWVRLLMLLTLIVLGLYLFEGYKVLELEKDLEVEMDWSRDKINEISDMADSLWKENARLEEMNGKMRLVLELAGYSPDSAFLNFNIYHSQRSPDDTVQVSWMHMEIFSGTTGQVSSAKPLRPPYLPRLSCVPPVQLRHVLCSLVLQTAFDVDWKETPVVDLHFREGGLYRLWWSSEDGDIEFGSYRDELLGYGLAVIVKDPAGKLARWLR